MDRHRGSAFFDGNFTGRDIGHRGRYLKMIMRFCTAAGISLLILGVSAIAQEAVITRFTNHASIVLAKARLRFPTMINLLTF